MRTWISALVVTAATACALAQAAPANRGGRRMPRFVQEVLEKYKAQDPKAHAELMKLRESDPRAFRRKVGELVRKARGPSTRRAAPFRVPDTVKVVRDIVYARYGTREVKLDLYLPKAPPAGKLPCIMVIHGGGWRSGDKNRFARFASRFAEEGFAAACIAYRLRPEVQVRQCVEDAKASVRWVRAHAKEHRIDEGRIGAFGGSAGAHLAAMLGTSFKAKSLEGKGGHEGVSSRVHAVVSLATPADLTAFGRAALDKEAARLISPAAYVDPDSARFLLMHARGDRVVPYKQSTILLEKLKAANVPSRLVTLEGNSHAFWNGTTPEAVKALADAVAFFQQALKGRKPQAAGAVRGGSGGDVGPAFRAARPSSGLW
jgi:acetyl esterase/lipase